MKDSDSSDNALTIVLATGNAGKVAEMTDLLAQTGARIKSVADFEDPPQVVEDQPDLAGNALKKARAWYAETGLISVADDTGLEVNFLGGAPGVYSARYAGEDGNAEANISKLLVELANATHDERRAQFRTVVAVVSGVDEQCFHGLCKGAITKSRRGTGGFGYDPVFIPDGFDRSFAELSKVEKNAISHRGKAVRAAAEYLELLSKSLSE